MKMMYFSITVIIQAPFKPASSNNIEEEPGNQSLTFFIIWRLAFYKIHTLFMFSLILFAKVWSVFF